MIAQPYNMFVDGLLSEKSKQAIIDFPEAFNASGAKISATTDKTGFMDEIVVTFNGKGGYILKPVQPPTASKFSFYYGTVAPLLSGDTVNVYVFSLQVTRSTGAATLRYREVKEATT